jgi:protein disulfide-isomerase
LPRHATIMKRLLVLSVLLLSGWAAAAQGWQTDLGVAQAKAYAENRFVLLNFTGSDWCGWCIRLRDEVFSKPEFENFATRNLVLVEVDFPRRKALSPAQRQANAALAAKYFVQGYPTIVLLNSKGDKVGELGYMQGGPGPFINAIREMTGLKSTGKGEASTPAGALFNGAPSGPPPKYKELSLKSINKARKLALINNQTLGVGETAKVRLGEGEVKVRCEEIRDKSVIVTVNGAAKRQELPLRGAD